jgi:hypothetical protein
VNPPTTLLGQVRGLLTAAQRAYAGSAQADEVGAIVRRLDEPLRVAIAGKVKAGKSTLLNALVGEELAPTNAGECTKIVTWYCDGLTYRVTLHPHQGDARTVPFTRDGGAVDVHLGACDADSVERLVVEWPSSSLRTMTLIDTPGIASLSTSVSARTHAFLSSSDEQVTPADAVLYLMRHLHASDIDFLETFHDQEFSQPSPVNAIAVLSRADEIGVGRLDAMASAARIAERYRGDDKVRRLCQTVVPVAGLLAQSGQGLREDEYKRFEALRRAPGAEVDALLLSADRFAGTRPPPPASRPSSAATCSTATGSTASGSASPSCATARPAPPASSPTPSSPARGSTSSERCWCRSSPPGATPSRPAPPCSPWRPSSVAPRRRPAPASRASSSASPPEPMSSPRSACSTPCGPGPSTSDRRKRW